MFTQNSPEIPSLLEKHGISATRQRREIATFLLSRPQHVTAEQIMEKLSRQGQAVSKATVYNTLNLLVDKGLLREVHIDASRTVYDSTTSPHHHFLNMDTGELCDIPVDAVGFSEFPKPPAGTVADGVDVIFRIRNRR